MALAMASQFSECGKYFAQIANDGKLKIWDTLCNSFEQEYTPDYHLTSPCTCLHFIEQKILNNKGVSPKKKKRRSNSESNFEPSIALGTASGLLLVYSLSKADLEYKINSETSEAIRCLSTSDNSKLYSGAEQHVLVWNLENKKLGSKWKVGNEKIASILAIPESILLLTASKTIKLWDVDKKEVLKTFIGHSSEIIFLQYVAPNGKGDAYFVSGSKGDRILSCWNLSDYSKGKHAVASFLMEDFVQSISLHIANDGSTNMAATVKSGVVHVYQHTLNGKCGKPFKPKTTIHVVSDTGQTNDIVRPIRIVGAVFREDDSLSIGYGTDITLTFENVTVCTTKKVQCLVRKEKQTISASKSEQVSKTLTPTESKDVYYLTSQIAETQVGLSTNKRKSDGKLEVSMEKRLENLTLNKVDGSKVPKVDNVAQLLLQGLHSKDKSILKTVLYKKDEVVIRNTVKRLPVGVLVLLMQELTKFIQGKTLSSQIGYLWMKHILQVHAGILISNPELPDLLGSALGSIENRLKLLTPLNRLKGRLDLLMPQVSGSSTQESIENEEPLLVYNDKDSSDSDQEDFQMDIHSESENEWEEDSNGDKKIENNVDSASDSEMSA